jgi:hypothetical protein
MSDNTDECVLFVAVHNRLQAVLKLLELRIIGSAHGLGRLRHLCVGDGRTDGQRWPHKTWPTIDRKDILENH